MELERARAEWQRLYQAIRKAWLTAILGTPPDD